jgi:hypothetical protein
MAEGIDAHEVIFLPSALCILLEQICDIFVVVDVGRHIGVVTWLECD